jgi:hypothetical protein
MAEHSIAHERLMTTDDVADFLGCTPRQVRKLPIRFVRIGVKLGRYRQRDVDAHLTGQEEEGVRCYRQTQGLAVLRRGLPNRRPSDLPKH